VVEADAADGRLDGWREKLPLLACGLLTPHQGNSICAVAGTMRLDEAELLHKAFRSLVVVLIADRAPSYALFEWAQVTKTIAASFKKLFPSVAERFISLRCMLLDAAEQMDWRNGEQADRPAVGDLAALLAAEAEPLTAAGISEAIGLDEHAVAKRLRLAILTGHVAAHYDDWKTVKFSSAAVAA
jgi:hypothetical protein